MPFKSPPRLDLDAASLAEIATKHCKLPHPETVRACSSAIFPTIRDQKLRGRLDETGSIYLDDNVTPRWALFWTHGIGQTHHPSGWTIAHVWGVPKDPTAYTHLANLVLMPEALASLSDKNGPLSQYLQYHAQSVYSWSPQGCPAVTKPSNYDALSWQYFQPYPDPLGFVADRMKTLKNQRVYHLRPLMGL